MKISEFSVKSNISIDTIRYYEKLGLLKANRLSNNRKDYTEDNIKQLQNIIMLKRLNLSLDDISVLFNLNEAYSLAGENLDEKISVVKKSKSVLDKAYSNLLEIESQIKTSKKLLEKSISKINMALESAGDLP